jgi:hypothetical protein
MKKLTAILLIAALTLALTGCGEKNDAHDTYDPYALPGYGGGGEDFNPGEGRKALSRITAENKDEGLNWVLDFYSRGIGIDNIVIGTPIKITDGEYNKGEIGTGFFVTYSFKITDNLTGNKLPEYIEVRSQFGDVLEIGKEYCISPMHNYNALWDSHILTSWPEVIPRELLSESDIESIRNVKRTGQRTANLVIENAAPSAEFVSNVGLAVVVKVTQKTKEPSADTIYDISYTLVDVLKGKEHAHLLDEGLLRINTNVSVGKAYLVLLGLHDDGAGGLFTLPAARNGAVISRDSVDYAKYVEIISN